MQIYQELMLMKSFNDSRWASTFQDKKVYAKLLDDIETFVTEKTSQKIPTDYFTPHDSLHSFAVELIIKDLIDKSNIDLTELEKFLLFASVWTHDIGMTEEIAIKKLGPEYSKIKAREVHEEISAWFLNNDKDFKGIFLKNGISESLFRTWIHSLNIICKYHRRKYEISDCPKVRRLSGNQIINIRLLACLIRFADTLHVDSSRFDKKIYDILQIGDFDRTARLHWLKSYLVSAVCLDIKKGIIYVTIDLPELTDPDDLELRENAQRLKFFIYENIYEDLEAVSDTIKEYDYNFYSSIKLEENFCPGFQDGMREEVINILNDLNIVSAPNSTNVIDKSLRSLDSLSRIDFQNYEIFYKNFYQLLESLKNISVSRPCHVGLNIIISKLENYFEHFPKDTKHYPNEMIKEMMDPIIKEKNNILERRKNSKEDINNKHKNKLNGIKNIFLFAFSRMVVDLLISNKSENFKNNINIYIFECASKRRFSITNNIDYNDGILYAYELHKAGFKNISILPETSFSSMLNDPNVIKDDYAFSLDDDLQIKNFLISKFNSGWINDAKIEREDLKKIILRNEEKYLTLSLNNEINELNLEIDGKIERLIVITEGDKLNVYDTKKSVLLLGANGIDLAGNCGHTSGHMMMVIVARHYHVPVFVVADSFKIGKIAWNPSLKREGPNWLSGIKTILKELRNKNINIINYREDKIPIEMIDDLLMDGYSKADFPMEKPP